jgi:hypothetical protein
MEKRRLGRSGVVHEMRPRKRQFVPVRELAEAFADIPPIDYEQLRADIDAVVDQDPTPRYWVD